MQGLKKLTGNPWDYVSYDVAVVYVSNFSAVPNFSDDISIRNFSVGIEINMSLNSSGMSKSSRTYRRFTNYYKWHMLMYQDTKEVKKRSALKASANAAKPWKLHPHFDHPQRKNILYFCSQAVSLTSRHNHHHNIWPANQSVTCKNHSPVIFKASNFLKTLYGVEWGILNHYIFCKSVNWSLPFPFEFSPYHPLIIWFVL